VSKLIRPNVASMILERAEASRVSRLTGAESAASKKVGDLSRSLTGLKFLSPTAGFPLEQTNDISEMKAEIRSRINDLNEGVKKALGKARLEALIVAVPLILTSLATVSAVAWSNALGAITTVTAGGPGTSIVYFTSDSLRSYFSLKNKTCIHIMDIESRIEPCKTVNCLKKINKEVDDLFASLYKEKAP